MVPLHVRPLPLLGVPLLATTLSAQKPASQDPVTLPPVRVTAFRLSQDPFELPRQVSVVDLETLTRRDQSSVLDALDREIGIWIEKRTATTSDPVIRGLSGANILATIDGNPITTFWGEGGFAGDDLYGKVEAESIERIEVIRGPASVQYGANALGGVIDFHTRAPRLEFPTAGVRFGGRAKTSFDTVNDGFLLRTDVEAALPRLRTRIGGTWRDLEDGSGGHGVGRLAPSGGEDLNFDGNAEYRVGGGDGTVFLRGQSVRRREIARFYRPDQRNENDRVGIDLGYRSSAPDANEGFEARVYWQDKEDRRRFANGNVGIARWETLATDWTWRTDRWQDHRLAIGLTLRRDTGESPDDEQFTIHTPGGAVTKAAPDQEWYNAGLFAYDEWQLSPWLSLAGGVRLDRFRYRSVPDSQYTPPVGDRELDRLTDWTHAVTGGVGVVVAPDDDWRVFTSWSRGFRTFAPKFGITQHGYGVLVPTGLLDPIVADNYELGVRHRGDGWDSTLVGYHTDFDGFQNPVAGTFQGQTHFDYDNNGMFDADERVFVTSSNGEASVQGIEWNARLEPHAWWEEVPDGLFLSGGLMWNQGTDHTNDEPLRHTHPARGLIGIGYEEPLEQRWYCQLTADIVRSFTRIPPARLQGDVGYRLDPQDPTSPLLRDDGLPGYTVYDLDVGYRISRKVRVGANLENLTDKNYRAAHSRMDAFGFNAGFFVEAVF